jgi:putative colanic acid biosynthesis UDP-glucose lipid carrier transferase
MMLSGQINNNIVEPRSHTAAGLSFFKQFKISSQKMEIFAPVIDLSLLVLTCIFVATVAQNDWFENSVAANACLMAGIVNGVLYVYSVIIRGLYRFRVLLEPMPYFSRLLAIFASAALLASGSLFFLKGNVAISPGPLAAAVSLQFVVLVSSRWVFATVTRAALAAGNLDGRRVVTVGEPEELMRLSAKFLLQYFGWKEVSRVPLAMKHEYDTSEVVTAVDRAMAMANEQGAEEFLIVLRWGSQDLLEMVRSRLRASPLPIQLLPDHSIRTLLGQRGSGFANTLLQPFPIQRSALSPFERVVKRALDIIVSVAAIAFFLPLLSIAAVAIKLDSPGPVIFRQRRSGFNAKKFFIFKFRSMTVLEDGPVVTQACREDLRVTRIGKFLRRSSLDELPQLFNVLKGDMSLVGPRPHALAHDAEYRVHIAEYTYRHRVKPGITGWAQVHGLRGETASIDHMAERVKLDLWYIDNWSLWLDLNILLRTCFEVLRDRAY